MKLQPIVLMLSILLASPVFGQDKGDVFNPSTEVTWLGLDFSGRNLSATGSAWALSRTFAT